MKSAIQGILCGLVLILSLVSLQAACAETPDLATADGAAACEGLQGGQWTSLPSAPTWVISATYHAKTAERRAYCDVKGYVNPTVNFGLWLPADHWNGRFIVRGCGGSCGVVLMEASCGKHLRDNYACLQTDMGHSSGQIDNNWATDNLPGLVDFGYRSTHVTAVAGRAILTAYYNGPPRYSYFYACSTGGRQAMVEAERFPADFDGIIAVAPVDIGPFGVSGSFGASNYVPPGAMNADAHGHPILTDHDIPMIYAAVMQACDLKDGVADGLFAPSDCTWDPGALACKAGGSASHQRCLNAEQVDLVRRFYAKGAQRGSELNWIGNLSHPPGTPDQFSQPRGDPVIAETLMNAGNPDLRVFKAHGGKLILAHGTTDLVVLPGQTIDYYETATRVMNGAQNTTDFFRFFLIPGMDHCSGGDGAWGIDYLAAMRRWTEEGHAPDTLIGVHPKLGVSLDYFGIDSGLLHPEEIAFSRPHFAYPMKAYYSGQGDPNNASSFLARAEPIGLLARSEDRSGRSDISADGLASELLVLVKDTELAYVSTGLPPKNVSDRIAKAVRRELYLDKASSATVVTALDRLIHETSSVVAKPALQSVRADYTPPV